MRVDPRLSRHRILAILAALLVACAALPAVLAEDRPSAAAPGEDRAVTHSVIMRSKTGSIRYMTAVHDLARLRAISAITVD